MTKHITVFTGNPEMLYSRTTVAELDCGYCLCWSSDVMIWCPAWLMKVVEEVNDVPAVSRMILSTAQDVLRHLPHSSTLSLRRCRSLHPRVYYHTVFQLTSKVLSKIRKRWQHFARYLYFNCIKI